MVFGFGPFEIDLATCELRRDGRSVRLQPRVFGTLRYLIEHRDRVVGKQELIDALWAGSQLNSVAVPWTINRVRRALGQESKEQGFIHTVRGYGYRFVGELRIAGESAPPERAASSSVPPALQPRVSAEPFVGRADVMAQLIAALDAVKEAGGALYLLSGEAGIGKTRCASEFAVSARRRGLQVWLGRCFDGAAPAFWPFIQVLRAACSDVSLHERARREGEALLAELAPHLPAAEERAPSPDMRFWLLDRLSRWLSRSARSQVRVVVLDDMHCADEGTLRALALLAPLLAQSRMLVLATARECGVIDAANPAPSLATRLRPCEHVALTGLSLDEVETYLTAALGAEPSLRVAQAAHTLQARTAGNPLFVREVARFMRAQYERDGEIRVQDVQLPQAVKDLIRARFLALDSLPRTLLDAACVVGEEFSVPLLQRATGLSAQDVLAGLEAAVLANIVESKPDGSRHAFVHPLMREVLYSALPTAQRANLHAAIGLALESLSLIEPRLDELAYHFHHAPAEPYYERAARYGRLAADAAMRVFAYDHAARFYAWALEAHPHLPAASAADACELLIRSAEALMLTGDRKRSREQCERAMELARAEKLPHLLVRAARPLRPTVWFAQVPDPLAAQALKDALALLPESAAAPRAYAYSQLALLPPYSLKVELGGRMSEDAVRLARGVDDPPLLLEALRSRMFSLSGPGATDALLRVTDEILKLDVRPSPSKLIGEAQLARYQALLYRGDRADADRALAAFENITRSLRMRGATWHAERMRAQRTLDAGRLDEAELRFNELWAEGQRIRTPLASVFYRTQMYALNLERTGKRLSATCEAPRDDPSWAECLPGYRTHRLQLAIETGDLTYATREFRSLAERHFAVVTRDSRGLSSLAYLAEVAVALSEHDAAIELRSLLQPYAELSALTDLTFSTGCIARYLAVLDRLLGEPTQARERYEIAIANNARSGHELERLRSCLGLAELLGASTTRSERVRAHALAAEVGETASRYGAHALRASANRLDARLEAATDRALALPDSSRARRSSRVHKSQRRAR